MKSQSVSKGFAALSFAGILSKILALIYIPFLNNILTSEGYGVYSAAYQVFLLIYVITNSGIPVALSKLISEYSSLNKNKTVNKIFKISLTILTIGGLIFSALMFMFSGTLANLIKYPNAQIAISALAPAVFLTSIMSVFRGYFQGYRNMYPTAISQILEQFANTIFTLFFAYILISKSLPLGVAGGTIGTSIGALIGLIYLIYIYMKSKQTYSISEETVPTKVLISKLWQYALPITLSVVLQYGGNLIDVWNTKSRLLIAGFDDNSASALYGYLFKYQQIMNAPISIAVALAMTLLPTISTLVTTNNKKELQNKINFSLKLIYIIAIPSAIIFSLFSTEIYRLTNLGNGSYLMFIGSPILILMCIVQVQNSILQGAGKFFYITTLLLLGIISKIVLNYYLISIPQININGAIIGSFVSFLIPCIVNMLLIKKTLKINLHIYKSFFSHLLSGFSMIIIILGSSYILNSYNLISNYLETMIYFLITSIISFVVYLVTLVLLKEIKKSDIEILPKKIVKFIPTILIRKM